MRLPGRSMPEFRRLIGWSPPGSPMKQSKALMQAVLPVALRQNVAVRSFHAEHYWV